MEKFQFSSQRFFPFDDIENRLNQAAANLGLTPENIASAEEENALLAKEVQDQLAGLKRQAGIADALAESMAYLQSTKAQLEDLQTATQRIQDLEDYAYSQAAREKELICLPWTRSQLTKSIPWLLVGVLLIAFGFTALASRSAPTTNDPQPTTIK